MDVEKTIQFLLDHQAGHDERLAKLETNVTRLATIAEMQIVSHDRLAERTAAGFAKVDEQLRQLAESQKATDAQLKATDVQLKATDVQLKATDDRLNALIQIVDGVIRRPRQ
jgi:septal ring factor EnvC (AmiA/AmiB activator)